MLLALGALYVRLMGAVGGGGTAEDEDDGDGGGGSGVLDFSALNATALEETPGRLTVASRIQLWYRSSRRGAPT